MYTLEERMKAVELYIQSGFSEGAVIRTLGNGRGRYYIMSSRYSKETNSTVGYV